MDTNLIFMAAFVILMSSYIVKSFYIKTYGGSDDNKCKWCGEKIMDGYSKCNHCGGPK